jgi:hypothetical protein
MPMNLLTVKQAIELIEKRTGKSISARQLRHEIQIGHLKATKIANTYFIEPSDIDNYKRNKPGRPCSKILK